MAGWGSDPRLGFFRFEGFVGKFALGNFLQRDVHEGHPRGDGDQGAEALAELTDPQGDHVDKNLRVLDFFESALNQFLFHEKLA